MLARRPRLLVLDEPTSGLDPVARHEALAELMEVLKDDERSILFSSHNTLDVEQISDQITFIDRGRIVDSNDKEVFLDRWRRLSLDVARERAAPRAAGRHGSRAQRPHGRRHDQRVLRRSSHALYEQRRRHRSRRAAHDARGDLRRHRHAQPKGARRMSNSMVWRLIAKDLYLYRWLIGGALVAGLASLRHRRRQRHERHHRLHLVA